MSRAAAIGFLCLLSLRATSQTFTGGFTFYLPPADTGSSCFIPAFPRSPLTDQDFVAVDQGGHFSVQGQRIRFFGANLVGDGAFPTASKAWFIAGRLRKMGFNLVRFHHMDNPWSSASLFSQGTTTRQLDPVTLDRLENILNGLKQNGIYADINLHVSRTFTALDGIPDADSLQEYGKGINYFDPLILALHKEFARQLMTHVSAYTGKALVNDPVMAMIEITNENSLYRYWRDGKLRPFSGGGILTTRHAHMLDSLWLSFLRLRYASTAALAAAWNEGACAGDAANRVVNGTFESAPPAYGWTMEMHAPASASVSRDSLERNSGIYAAKVTVSVSDGTDWHLQWKQIGLTIVRDSLYVITFAARADSVRRISVSLMNDVSPWTWYGGTSVLLLPVWQTFSFSVRAPETVTGTVRLSFGVGGRCGSYWFDDLSMKVSGVAGLLPGESLESSSVRRVEYTECPVFTDRRVSDLSSFYLGLEDAYFAAMHSFLKDTLGVKVPIVGTNWNVGPADIVVQSKLDYIDNHAYWDHPSFPGVPWSATDWTITNTPMVESRDGGTISGLMAAAPVQGKPFTISEYNHPFPNQFQSEAPLFLSAYGSFHDADAVMFFDYGSSVDDWETDMVSDYFSIHRNSVLMGLVPSCALAFRRGMISRAQTVFIVNYAPDDYLTLPRRDNAGWAGPSLVDRMLALSHGVRSGSFNSPASFDPSALPAAPVNPYVSDTREITWDTGGLLTVSTPQFVGASGQLSKFADHQVGPLTMKVASGFGTLTWVSVTEDSLRESRRSLLTVSTRLRNSGMVWDGTTTIHDDWGSSPTLVAPIALVLSLSVQADSLRLYPLGPQGDTAAGGVTYLPLSPNRFDVAIDQTTTRTLWFGIQSFGKGSPVFAPPDPDQRPLSTYLFQNYPNPFNPKTEVRYQVSDVSNVRVVIYDLLGQEVATLVNEVKRPGTYEIPFDGSTLASGIYLCRLTVGRFVQSRKLILMK